jgi:hypothetical protein
MICTSRDSEMMKTVGRYGVLSTEQLAKIFFPNTALTTVRRRLRLLEDEDMIYRVSGLDNGGVAWALTKSEARKIGCMYPIRHFNRNSLKHDVLLSEVRHRLESIGMGESWVPEHVLKAQAYTNRSRDEDQTPFVPDALFSVRQKGESRVVALELELNGKHRKRYENILSRYRRKKTLWAVWYLVTTDALGKTLEKVWKEINGGRRNDLLMWSSLASFFKDPRETRVRSEHFSYSLKDLVETKAPALMPALPGALPGSNPINTAAKQFVEPVF